MEIYEGNMTADKYSEMIEERFWAVAQDIMDDYLILQQDGARAHTASSVTSMLEENNIQYLDWLPRSPDLSPIENVWALLENAVYRRDPDTVKDLKDMIQEEWDHLDDNVIGRLARSFKSRLEQVMEVEGEAIGY